MFVGGMGIYGMGTMGLDEPLHIKSAKRRGNALGRAIFGVGMAILGQCTGNGVAAIGDGSLHAIPGVLGGVLGAAPYTEAYPWMTSRVLGVGDLGKVTLDSVTGLSPRWLMAALAVGFALMERWERRPRGRRSPGAASVSPALT